MTDRNVGEFNVSLVYENHTPVPNADAIFVLYRLSLPFRW